jgi:hypothetical protein
VDLELASFGIRFLFQNSHRLTAPRVVLVTFIVAPAEDHFSRTSKHSPVVDVSVGIFVVGDAVREPNHLGASECLQDMIFDLLLGQLRVAIRIQQALLSGEDGAFAVGMDGTSFQHERDLATTNMYAILCCDSLAHLFAESLVLVAWPVASFLLATIRIEIPIDPDKMVRVIQNKGRTRVSRPGIITRSHMTIDPLGASFFIQLFPHLVSKLLRVAEEENVFELGDGPGDSTILLTCRFAVRAKNLEIMWIGHQTRTMRFPLGWHVPTVVRCKRHSAGKKISYGCKALL